MKFLAPTTAVLLALSIGVAHAQDPLPPEIPPVNSRADCAANFNWADQNADGTLDMWEISEGRQSIPTSLDGDRYIGRQDFLNACNTEVQGQKQ